ncbi:hypothetical protein L6R53_02985 [Myxococcota bacterium]|nr:hypothetical protein [Myxococcota bacterium]
MSKLLSAEELQMLAAVPERDLVDLVIDLDIPVEEDSARIALLEQAVRRLAELARAEGLPLSTYDLEDLQALPAPQLQALARAMRVSAEPRAVVKAGEKVFKTYRKRTPRSQVPLMVPSLLAAVTRLLAEEDSGAGGGATSG